jgi:hypothetical protein
VSVAQTVVSPSGADSLLQIEMKLKALSDSIVRGVTDLSRQAALAEFNPLFFDLLQDPATFSYPFDSLKGVSKVRSTDQRIRVISWTVQSRTENNYKYFGVVQLMNPKTGEMKRFGLNEVRWTNEEAEQKELFPEEWYPALYYEIIERKVKKKTWYFLLGWQGNTPYTTRKVIDVLGIDAWNNVTFGAPVFIDENQKKKYRFVFEYSAQAVMMLKYDRKKKMIVFDHLSPVSPTAKGQYQYYGPDFTYDGLVFRKGFWNYKQHLILKNPR